MPDWLKIVLGLGSPVVVIFMAGGLYREFQLHRKDWAEFKATMKPIIEEWAGMKQRVAHIEDFQSRLASDHRQLRDKLGETREKLASIDCEQDDGDGPAAA